MANYKSKGGRYSTKEKAAYKRGFFSGLFARRKNERKQKTLSKDPDFIVAQRYARHMGNKYNLSDKEVQANTREHYRDMQKDASFANALRREYGFDLFEKEK